MTDLIRHSAAHLLAISLALAGQEGDAPKDMAAATDQPPVPQDPISSAFNEAALKLAQK